MILTKEEIFERLKQSKAYSNMEDREFWHDLAKDYQENSQEELEEAGVEVVKAYSTKELFEKEFPPTTWLVEGLIPSEGFTALTGTPASYKSFLTEHLAICLTQEDTPFLGHFPVTPGAVLFIDKENPLSLLKDRLLKLGATPDSKMYFLQEPDQYNIHNPEDITWTSNFIRENDIKLVIIDSFVHVHRGDENDSQAIAATFEILKQLPCAVLFIHHHRKTIKFFTGTPLESIRGSSDIAAELESHLAVDQVPGGLRIAQYKNRRGELIQPFLVSPIITEESVSFSYGGGISEEVSKLNQTKDLIREILISDASIGRKELIEAL